MGPYNLLLFIYFLSCIENNVFNLYGDSSKVIFPSSSSLLQLSLSTGHSGSSENFKSEFQRLNVIEPSTLSTTKNSAGNSVVICSHLELSDLRETLLSTFKKVEDSYNSLTAHPINDECIGSIILVLEVCYSELSMNHPLCKSIKGIIKRVKKNQGNYSRMLSRYLDYYKKVMSSLLTLNSILNLSSQRFKLSSSYVEGVEQLIADASSFLEAKKSFLSYILGFYMQFCSVSGITFHTNKVDREIQSRR